jgi:hypothetical protein
MFVRDFDQIRALAQGLRTIDCSRVDLGRLRHIASGTYNDVFSYELPENEKAVLRLSYYNKSTIQSMEDLIAQKKATGGPEYANRKSRAYKQLMVQARNVCSTDSVWIKIHFSDLTNFLVKNNVSPHFVYTLSSKDCKKALEHISKALPINTLKNRTDTKSSCHTRYNNISFQEPFDMDVTRALKRARDPQDLTFRMTDDDLRSIIFQVLFTLATLQHYVPMFRHNDISTNNVLLKNIPMNATRYTYQLYDMRFQLVGPRLFAAIHDFDLAHADAYIMHMGGDRARFSLQNKVVMKKGFKGNATGAGAIAPDYDPSFDAYFFLRVLRGQISGESGTYPQTHAWLKNELMVDKYPLKYLQTVDPTFVPVNLLRSNYFNALRDQPSSAPAMFGPRQIELDIHVGGQPVYSGIEQRITGTQTMPILSNKSNKRAAFVDRNNVFVVTRPLETRWKPLILKFYEKPQETDVTGEDGAFRHDAAIAYQACESEDPAALAWLAHKLGVPTINKDAKVLCADLRKAVQIKWYETDAFDESERVVHPRCPSFFTDEDILEYARTVGVPEEDLYDNLVDFKGNKVPKSREELCLLAYAATQSSP